MGCLLVLFLEENFSRDSEDQQIWFNEKSVEHTHNKKD